MFRPEVVPFFLTITVIATSACGVKAAPVQWLPAAGGNGHYYELVLSSSPSGNLTWFQARDAAAATIHLGSTGHLLTVTSAAEDAFIRSAFESNLQTDFLPGASGDFAWIGLTDAVNEGVYRWITGEPFAYSNWAPPEPNNFDDEDYVHLWRRDYADGNGPLWSWNDSDPGPGFSRWDTARVGYIVEFDGPFVAPSLAPVPEPATTTLYGLLGGALCAARVGRRLCSRRGEDRRVAVGQARASYSGTP